MKKNLKIREDIPTKPIEVNIESTGIAQDEPVFLDTTDQQETEEKTFGVIRRKHEIPNLTIHQSSQCRVIIPLTYTKTQQL